jgi:hypothetical protein
MAILTRTVILLTLVMMTVPAVMAQRTAVLRGVKQITVEETVVGNSENVKEDFAPTLVADSLRNALRDSNFDVVDEGRDHFQPRHDHRRLAAAGSPSHPL